MSSVFVASDMAPVFQEQVFGSFEDVFVGFGGFSVFGVSHFVDDAVESGHHMKQVEDDFDMRDLW